MSKRDFTIIASLAPMAAIGLAVSDEATAQPTSGYEPNGIPAGGFRLFPELRVSVVNDDNVFAATANEQSDYLYELLPSARLESDWSTHELNLFIDGAVRSYSDNSQLDSEDYRAGLDGRIDVARDLSIAVSASAGKAVEPLSATPVVQQLSAPIEYDSQNFKVKVSKEFNLLSVSAEASYGALDYQDATLLAGGTLDQDSRDRKTTRVGVRADYEFSPSARVFVSAEHNKREYDVTPATPAQSRDSDGLDAYVGIAFDATDILTGEIGVGYLEQSFDNPNVSDVTGLAVKTALNWSPDALVNVRVTLDRNVRDAGITGAVAYVGNDFGVDVNYAIRRNVDIGVRAQYRLDDYSDIDREDERWGAGASVNYALNRGVALFGSVSHSEQDSTGVQRGRVFENNTATIGIRLRR